MYIVPAISFISPWYNGDRLVARTLGATAKASRRRLPRQSRTAPVGQSPAGRRLLPDQHRLRHARPSHSADVVTSGGHRARLRQVRARPDRPRSDHFFNLYIFNRLRKRGRGRSASATSADAQLPAHRSPDAAHQTPRDRLRRRLRPLHRGQGLDPPPVSPSCR